VKSTASAIAIQSIDGSSGNPYDNLYDGLARAYELGAPYSSATVNILLYSGTHSMLRTTYGYYLPSASDINH
jgi:hypothetical protein